MPLDALDDWWVDKWTVHNINLIDGSIGLKKDKSKFRIECDDNGFNWRLKIRRNMYWDPKGLNLTDAGKGVAKRFTSNPFVIDGEGLHVLTLTRVDSADEIKLDIAPYVGKGGIGRGSADSGRG